jgi:hypothetical protein
MADDDEGNEDFEDVDEDMDVAADWEQLAVSDNMDLDEQWVGYLAQADVPSNAEGVDVSIPDFDDGTEGTQEEHYV